MSKEDLSRRVRAARAMLPDDPAWSEDYPTDELYWCDAPMPAHLADRSQRRAHAFGGLTIFIFTALWIATIVGAFQLGRAWQ